MEAIRRPKQARGEERREHILRATLAAIGRDGVAAVTHRSIAARAGVALGSLTYYFPAKEDLLREALVLFVEEEVERLDAIGRAIEADAPGPGEIAQRFAAALQGDDNGQVAQFELYLEASRTPGLRACAAACLRAYQSVAEIALRAAGVPEPERRAGLFVALIDGLALQRTAAPEVVPPLREALLELFGIVSAGR